MAGCYCGAAGSFGLATGRGVTLARAPTPALPRGTSGPVCTGEGCGPRVRIASLRATWGSGAGARARGERVGQTAASEPSEPCGLGRCRAGRPRARRQSGRSQAKGGGCWATRRCFLFNNGPWTRFLTPGPVEDIRRPLGPGPATGAFPASGPFYP